MSTARCGDRPGSVILSRVRTLDVSLPALPRAAAGLLAFADDLPLPQHADVGGDLAVALEEFCRSWSRALDALAQDARAAAAEVSAAAETYARLERLLMGGLR